MNILQKFEAKQLAKLQGEKQVPQFSPGDTIKVNVKIKEGTRERIQAYEGVCIARTGEGMNENFCVRKISYGEGVERTFPLWSNRIESIELVRRGSVRRAKLYFLRDLRGKSARISERTSGHGFEAEAEQKAIAQEMTQTQRRAIKKAEKDATRAEARAANEAATKAKADAKAAEIKAAADAKAAEAKAAEDAAKAAAAAAEAPAEQA